MSSSFKTIKIYLSYWQKRPWLAMGSFLSGPSYVLLYVVSPLFIAKAVGELASKHSVSVSNIWLAGVCLISGAILWYIADNYLSKRLHALTVQDMHSVNFHHLISQDYSFFTNSFGGSLVAQANRFARSYELFHTVFFLDILGQFCGVVVALGVMVFYNVILGLAITTLWIFSVVIVIYLGIRRMPIRRRAVAMDTQQTGELADVVTNVITVKTFANEHAEIARYDRTNKERTKRYLKSWDAAIRNQLVIQVICILLQMIVLIGGISAVQTGKISIAIFLLFEVYILRIIDSITKSGLYVRQLEGLLGDAQEMTELLERKAAIQDVPSPEAPRINHGEINFNHLNFSYSGRQTNEPLFKDFNLTIKAGERVGLVGPSGGGKTTITRLILRFHDIDSGSITIDGQDIAKIRQLDLHRHIAYVPQDPLLFHRSLAENIGYSSLADYDDIVAVAKMAHAHEFIESLPMGYGTLVGERGVKLSGGQRQRVAIARAMLKEAPILVLDEATSALDSESEKLVQDALWKLMENKTALVIAHRLSTIQRMDRIVVLDDGKIVEQGSHVQLLKNNGLYARLWTHQSGGFLEE